VNVTKAYRGSTGIAPLIFNLRTTWMLVISFEPQPLYPWGKNFWPPVNRRLGGSTASLYVSEKRKISCHCKESNPRLSSKFNKGEYRNKLFVNSELKQGNPCPNKPRLGIPLQKDLI